jgi:predicted ABC-type ATPase
MLSERRRATREAANKATPPQCILFPCAQIVPKRLTMKNKNVYIIAGPNGSGKTTFAKEFLPDYVNCPNFVNADLIAQGLAPFKPRAAAIKAGKLVLQQIDEYAKRGVDFAFETTLSGKSYASLLAELKAKGYALHLFFLWIPGPELAIARIKERVQEGGHYVPAEDVRRRFVRGISNFFTLYDSLLNSWMLFDNSKTKPVLIAKRRNGHREVINEELFQSIQKQAH